MNERFLKLAQETDVWCDQHFAGDDFYDLRWEEKFAELIVRECAITAGLMEHQGRKNIGAAILDSFGVGE